MTRKTYTGPILNVSFDALLCEHAAECVRGMPEVFNTAKRPWIDPGVADTEALAVRLWEVVAHCPSGALHIVEHDAPVPPTSDLPA